MAAGPRWGFQSRTQLYGGGEDMNLVPNSRGQDAPGHLSSTFDHAGVNAGLDAKVGPPGFGEGESLDAQHVVASLAPGVQHRCLVLTLWDHQGGSDLTRRSVLGFGRGPGGQDELSRAPARHVSRAECGPIHQPSPHAHKDAVVGGAQRMGVPGAAFPVIGCPPRPSCARSSGSTKPSRLCAHLSVIQGLSSFMAKKNRRLSSRASFSRQPTIASIPASVNLASPRPATMGLGSLVATTTRPTPRDVNKSAQGGVFPWWLHGSRVTYAVARTGRCPG